MIGWKDSSEDAYSSEGDYLHEDQVEEIFRVFSVSFIVVSCDCRWPYAMYVNIFHKLIAQCTVAYLW